MPTVDLSQLKFAVVDCFSYVAASLHQHPDSAHRFIAASRRPASDWKVVDIDTGEEL